VDLAGLAFAPSEPGVWTLQGDVLTGVAGARTDLFVDPASGEPSLNGPRLLTPAPERDFQLSAHVSVEFAGTFDAGVLLVWAGENMWAKLCFEYSPQGSGMVVSVVTRGLSDDANGYTVDGSSVSLRISRVGAAYSFHASIDEGLTWDFVRHFTLDGAIDVTIGFEVQSPTGEGCRARFTRIALKPTTLTDLRDGS
jgi:regulation of enolase protein 1 (concanavalin A-like superfamily)